MNFSKTNENFKSRQNTRFVTLEKIDFLRDRHLLSDWLQSQAVQKWWGNPINRLQQIENNASDSHALICSSGLAVGYLCWQKVVREALDSVGLFDVSEDLIDIDMFIGDPLARGQGFGPKALELLMLKLHSESGNCLAGLVTSVKNQSAIRAFEKSGFKKKTQFDSGSFGTCWFMEYETSD